MRVIGVSLAAASLALASGWAAAQTGSGIKTAPAWYAGLGAGVGVANFKTGDFDVASMGNNAGAAGAPFTSTANTERTSFSGKAFVGYRFNQFWGLELSYTQFGKFEYDSTIYQGATPYGSADFTYKVQATSLSAVLRYPFPNAFFVQGRLGATGTRTQTDSNGSAVGLVTSRTEEKWRTNLLVGAGVGYDFPGGLTLVAEYEYYGTVGDPSGFNLTDGWSGGTGRADVGLWSASAILRF